MSKSRILVIHDGGTAVISGMYQISADIKKTVKGPELLVFITANESISESQLCL